MDISTTQMYNASPSAVVQALFSSELAAKWVKLARIDDYTHTVDGPRATTVMNVPAERLPSKVRTSAGSGAKVTIITVVLSDSVTHTVDPHDPPAEVLAALRLSSDATTAADLSATLKVKVPLLGGKIEKKVTGVVNRLLAKDTKSVEEVVEEQGS